MMNWWKTDAQSSVHIIEPGAERRRDPRIGGTFKVRYSGTDDQNIIIGHATIVDLSRHGFGLTGNRGLKKGMELALFLELPETDRPLCIPQVRVLWINGNRCGMQLPAHKVGTFDWMDALLDCH